MTRRLVASIAIMALLVVAWGPIPVAAEEDYRLDTGDLLKISVFGEDDLSGEFKISDSGTVSVPLIGEITAQGLTEAQLEAAIVDALQPDYLVSPSVGVEVLNYRPFFIMGEVRSPGSYPYVSGMSVVEAVALAGGFTYRARTSEVFIRRSDSDAENEELVPVEVPVRPGDVIRVRERFF